MNFVLLYSEYYSFGFWGTCCPAKMLGHYITLREVWKFTRVTYALYQYHYTSPSLFHLSLYLIFRLTAKWCHGPASWLGSKSPETQNYTTLWLLIKVDFPSLSFWPAIFVGSLFCPTQVWKKWKILTLIICNIFCTQNPIHFDPL